MRNIYNYTGRKDDIRKIGNNPEIKILVHENNDLTYFEPIIAIDKSRSLAADSEIYIQPYSNNGFVGKPIFFGTINEPISKTIEESEVGKDEIKFRLKIVSPNKINSLKKVLATCYSIEPWGSSTFLKIGRREQRSLIEFEINPGDVPVLFFLKGYGLEKDIKQSNYLKNIFFNIAIKEILTTYVLEKELYIDCNVRKIWAEQFEDITQKKFPEIYDDDAKEWINLATSNFLNLKNTNIGKSLLDLMPDYSIELEKKLTY